jgi:hypothetical protein
MALGKRGEPAIDVEGRLGLLEGILARSSVARNLREERAREEEQAARLAGADVLAADATKRRQAASAAWVPAMRAYRETVQHAIADLAGAAADLDRVCQADEDARADLLHADEMLAKRERVRVPHYEDLDRHGQPTWSEEDRIIGQLPHVAPALPRLGNGLIDPAVLVALDAAITEAQKGSR